MDVVPLLLLAFVVLWRKQSQAIDCYRCLPDRPNNNDPTTPLCEGFDHSAKFIKKCPLSTGCIKKTTQLIGLGGITQSVERDCAFQTMSGYQEKDANGKWHAVDKIHEVYEEGCKEDSNEFDKPTRSTHCFCRGHLCNSAEKLTRNGLALTTIVVLWIVLT